jgi:hypothetical protein
MYLLPQRYTQPPGDFFIIDPEVGTEVRCEETTAGTGFDKVSCLRNLVGLGK